jgi:hypothetical protein
MMTDPERRRFGSLSVCRTGDETALIQRTTPIWISSFRHRDQHTRIDAYEDLLSGSRDMRQGNKRTADTASVTARFGLKLTIFLFLCSLQLAFGYPISFFVLAGLSAVLCLALALWFGERPFARSLTYWDEAAWFGLVACLA